jgi:outer membrane protein TolC
MFSIRSLSLILALISASAGCRSVPLSSQAKAPQLAVSPNSDQVIAAAATSAGHKMSGSAAVGTWDVRLAAHSENGSPAIDGEQSANALSDGDNPFAGLDELPLEEFVAAVKARNPTLQAAMAAWNAAANKYPQAIALDDPMLQSMFAPVSWSGASNVQSSYYIGIAQKLPWAGKRELRGNQANWETTAASFDMAESQLRLAEAARIAFFEYYLNQREQELTLANREALREFHEVARAKYEANQVSQQDLLQADVELAQQEQRQIEVDQEHVVVVARINTLLHRRADHPLPPPPKSLSVTDELPPVDALRDWAVEHRPELQAMAARIQAEQTAVALACKEFYPDIELMGRFDRFWTDREQQPQIGLNANIPLNKAKRHAAVQEALWRVHKLQAEYNQSVDSIRNDVQSAHARVGGARRTIQVFEAKILTAAQENVSAARAGYEAGTVDFLRLVEAQRQTLVLRENYQRALAEYHRRLAELERAVGSNVRTSETISTAPAVEALSEPIHQDAK